ncbi:MAG: anthranilate phosphoribosyltransferase [Acidobacteria bacterium]|nr:anthranilate phosphoribosyltransferase [Acidobacteriota bacterium]
MIAFLNKILAGENLTQTEAAALLEFMISAEATDAQIAAILIALKAKGETAEELAGFAQTMRARSTRINSAKHSAFIDTCGTGGSTAKTFNVSTAVAFVAAAAGVPVAKHGNVGVTSKSGSADVLRALGVKLELSPEQVGQCFDEVGLCFMFAPLHHAATKRVAMIRRELGVRTIFNFLGPLTNPAGAPFQIIGVSDPNACERVAQAAAHLGLQRAWIVRGNDGLDEITLADQTTVYEVIDTRVHRFELSPEEFGLARASLEELRGGSAEDNAATICALFRQERGAAALDLVLINAAAALHVAGKGETLRDSVTLARQTIEDGTALGKIEALRKFSQQ